MAAAAMLTGMTTLVSCSEDDDLLPEVIESEVYDEGIAEDVTAEVGTEGTTLSYESWIMVKGTTRASFDNRISVTLHNTLNNISREIDVTDWETGDAEMTFDYKAGESRQDGNYVTVTDSVLVCTVSYPNFSFDYELVYQVAVYDDGITRQTMPYHKYENIVDNGCAFSELDDVSENGTTYKRRLCKHSITVSFNGQEYVVSSAVILKKAMTGEDILLASKVIDEGISYTDTGDWSGQCVSWIMLEQTWSESGTKQVRKEVTLTNEQLETTGVASNVLFQMYGPEYFNYTAEVDYEAEELETRTVDEFTVTRYGWMATDQLLVNGAALSVGHYSLTYETAVYTDEFITHEMPSYRFGTPQTSFTVGDWYTAGTMYMLDVETHFSLSFGEKTFVSDGNMNFVYDPYAYQ